MLAYSVRTQGDELAQAPLIEGYFRRAQVKRTRRFTLPILILLFILVAAAFFSRSPLLLAVAIVAGTAALMVTRLSARPKRVKVSLAHAAFTVRGDGYDIRLEAPFRFKTGVERIPATEQLDETCFVRMVIDVHGKPLVFEEQVIAGYYPPQLDEIVGISERARHRRLDQPHSLPRDALVAYRRPGVSHSS